MYRIPIEDKLYKKLNRDASINKYFRSSSVGGYMKIIEEYYRSTDNFNKIGWENFYLTKERRDRLNEIYLILRDKLQNMLGVEIQDYIFYRVVGQTYNGFVTELNIIKEFQNEFPNIDFIKANPELDEKYFTDFEAYTKGLLIFGIQVKPVSYLHMSKPYQIKSKENHEVQRQNYMRIFKVPHKIVYYDKGELLDKEKTFNEINTILVSKII